jgi:hypothetical protein
MSDIQTSQPAEAGNAEPDTSALTASSATEAMAALLGGDPAEETQDKPSEGEDGKPPKPPAEEGADPDAPVIEEKKFTVKIDGKDVELTESELVNGYQAQKASTQKFEAAAALRKEAEAATTIAREERQQYAQGLQQAQALLGAALTEQSKIDWHALREADPVEFLKQKHLYDERQAAYQQNSHKAAQLQQVEVQERIKSFSEYTANEHQALLDKLPEWKDEAKAKGDKAKIADFLQSQGFKPEELFTQYDRNGNIEKPGLVDHRTLLLARKAMLYDEVMSKAKEAAKKVEALPKRTVTPDSGSVVIDKRGAQFQKLKSSGSPRDAAALMAQFVN